AGGLPILCTPTQGRVGAEGGSERGFSVDEGPARFDERPEGKSTSGCLQADERVRARPRLCFCVAGFLVDTVEQSKPAAGVEEPCAAESDGEVCVELPVGAVFAEERVTARQERESARERYRRLRTDRPRLQLEVVAAAHADGRRRCRANPGSAGATLRFSRCRRDCECNQQQRC